MVADLTVSALFPLIIISGTTNALFVSEGNKHLDLDRCIQISLALAQLFTFCKSQLIESINDWYSPYVYCYKAECHQHTCVRYNYPRNGVDRKCINRAKEALLLMSDEFLLQRWENSRCCRWGKLVIVCAWDNNVHDYKLK